MNSAPLPPEQIDLLLSADLDGEFDGAAEDLGLDPAAARALLESVPAVEARRELLALARDRMAEPVEIDELLAARLRSKALKAGADAAEHGRLERRRRRTRLYGIVGGIAAALLVVVALGASLNTYGGSDDTSSTAGGFADRAEAGSPTSGAVEPTGGDASTKLDELPLRSSYPSVDALADDVRTRREVFSFRTADTSSNNESGTGSQPAKAAATNDCQAVVQSMDRAAGKPRALGATSVAGEPVTALLYVSPDGRTLYFFDADCKLVNRQLIN
jgi:hypothetical protein